MGRYGRLIGTNTQSNTKSTQPSYDTGANFAQAVLSHGSAIYIIPPQNVKAERVIPARIHPGFCTGVRINFILVRNPATVSFRCEINLLVE